MACTKLDLGPMGLSLPSKVKPPALFAPNCSSVLVAEGLTMGGATDYAALVSAIGGILTVAIMIWIANAGRG